MDGMNPMTGEPLAQVGKRTKLVQIGLMFTATTDAEALEIKERVNAIVSDNPGIQLTFSMMERPAKDA